MTATAEQEYTVYLSALLTTFTKWQSRDQSSGGVTR
jgi:hypothetical protein